MCGRFVQLSDPEAYGDAFAVSDLPETTPRYNLAPTQPALVIRAAPGGARQAALLRWGLVPAWSQGPDPRYSMINARAETVHQKPAYRTALRRRRCLVPSEGFYEWQPGPGGKQPYLIGPAPAEGGARRPFAMAGLWDLWLDPAGEPLETFTIIVTSASPALAHLHERMPVILAPEVWGTWLDPRVQDPDTLLPLLRPYPGPLRIQPVSRRVNDARHDGPELIEQAWPS